MLWTWDVELSSLAQDVVLSTSPASICLFLVCCKRFHQDILFWLQPNACCSPKIHNVEQMVISLQHTFMASPDFVPCAVTCSAADLTCPQALLVSKTPLTACFLDAKFPTMLLIHTFLPSWTLLPCMYKSKAIQFTLKKLTVQDVQSLSVGKIEEAVEAIDWQTEVAAEQSQQLRMLRLCIACFWGWNARLRCLKVYKIFQASF